MDLRFWRGRKKKLAPKLRQVVSSHRIAFCGALPRTAPIEHCLYAVALTHSDIAYAMGHPIVGTMPPTHSIFCTCRLARDEGKTRIVFNVYLGLTHFKNSWQDPIAIEICKAIKNDLMHCPEPMFLVSEKFDGEFQFRHDADEARAQYWEINTEIAYHEQWRRLERAGLVEPQHQEHLRDTD